MAFKAFGQNQETAGRADQRQNMRQRFQNMTPQEREKFRAEMEERRKKFQNMSDEERQKLRAEMSERLGPGSPIMSREQQLAKIDSIEKQLAKLKVVVESIDPDARSKFRDLPEAERTKFREKMSRAMMERQMIIRDIEQQLATLKGSRRPPAEPRARLIELREIHKLALREKATQTADRLDKLIVSYQRGSQGRIRSPGQRRERPVRQEKTE